MRKRSVGRPPKGKDARSVRIVVKATPAEAKAWRARAKAENLPFTVWLVQPRRRELEG